MLRPTRLLHLLNPLHTLCSLIAGLSAPSNNSAVALLNAAQPSIGRYCMYKLNPSQESKGQQVCANIKADDQKKITSLFSPLFSIRFSACKNKNFIQINIDSIDK